MKKIVLFSLAFLILSGCTQNTLDRHVIRVGKMGDISITDLRSALVNNLLVAQGTFYNMGSKLQSGFYRCQFYDTHKMQIGDVQVWQPITIYPNEDKAIKCMATQIEATTFRLEFSADAKNVFVYNYK